MTIAGRIDNPLLGVSSLPFELPAFSRIGVPEYREAFDRGMAEQLAEIDAIVEDLAQPDFVNTVEAMERSGRLLGRASNVFFNVVASHGTDDLLALEAELAPQLSAHHDAIFLNRRLFDRIDAVHEQRREAGLDPESVRLVERYHLDFVRAGAQLSEPDSRRLTVLNRRLAELTTGFGQALLGASKAAAVLIDDEAQLDGMSESDVHAAAEAAVAAGHRGGYLIALVSPTIQPALSALTDREVRRRLYEASVSRAAAGPFDNAPAAAQIAALRAERAALLGFATHADYVTADATAGTTTAVDGLLRPLSEAVVAAAGREQELLARIAAADGVTLAAWDWPFYAERIRAAEYAVDNAALREYFELGRVLEDGVFAMAQALYGVTFEAREDLTGYHPDVRVFEVRDADGSSLGLFLADLYARPEKRGGAWMSSFVDQSRLLAQRPVVVNNLNIRKPAPGEPTLLTPDEARTLFHEFGHAVHGLFSQVNYPRFAGTRVPGDVVEFPSQVHEMWLLWPALLRQFAFSVVTGEPLPAEQVERIQAAERWGQGRATYEYLAATVLDQAWHRLEPGSPVEDVAAFERDALRAAGLDSELIPPRYGTCYFQHIFSGGYSAGYYFYIWAEVLAAATEEWFVAAGGLDLTAGMRFRDELLSVGGSRDVMDSVRAVLGRDPDVGPLLRRRGLDVAADA